MRIKDLIRLVNQVADGKDNFKRSSIGFNGYGFVFRSYDSIEPYVTGIGSSGLCSIGTYIHIYERFKNGEKLNNLKKLFEYNKKLDLLFTGALKTLIPSLKLGGSETLFDVWVFVKTPDYKLFPATFYYGQSGTSIGAWNPDIIISNYDIMSNQKIFPEDFASVINSSPFNFSKDELEGFIDALICALNKVPISDFDTSFNHDSGKFQLGIKSGEPYIIKACNDKESHTWSYSILGSDDAMELNYKYIAIINEYLTPEGRERKMKDSNEKKKIDKILINRGFDQLFKFARDQKSRLAFIVLGEFIMSHGGKITEDLRHTILKYSDWSFERYQFKNRRDRKERKSLLIDFREKLKEYDGTEKVYVPFYSVGRIINEREEKGEDTTDIWLQNIDYSIYD